MCRLTLVVWYTEYPRVTQTTAETPRLRPQNSGVSLCASESCSKSPIVMQKN